MEASPPPQRPSSVQPRVKTANSIPPARNLPRKTWGACADQYFENNYQPAFSDDEEDYCSGNIPFVEDEMDERQVEVDEICDPDRKEIMCESTASNNVLV